MRKLTPRQRSVLHLRGGGLHSGDIALRLGLARKTVDAHMEAITRKWGCATWAQADERYRLGEW